MGVLCKWAALAAVVVASPAVAQEAAQQTVPNAHRFIGLTFSNKQFPLSLPHAPAWLNSQTMNSAVIYHNNGVGSGCSTPLFMNIEKPGGSSGTRADVNWRKVAEIKRDGTRVTIIGGLAYVRSMTIDFLSENASTRIAFAMEFLRQECDPTRDTGF